MKQRARQRLPNVIPSLERKMARNTYIDLVAIDYYCAPDETLPQNQGHKIIFHFLEGFFPHCAVRRGSQLNPAPACLQHVRSNFN